MEWTLPRRLPADDFDHDGSVGRGRVMREVIQRAELVAQTKSHDRREKRRCHVQSVPPLRAACGAAA